MKTVRIWFGGFLLGIMWYLSAAGVARAAVQCGVDITPTSITPQTTVNAFFNLTNTGDQPIRTIHAMRPSDQYRIVGYMASGATAQYTQTEATLMGLEINPTETYQFLLQITTLENQAASNWTVHATDDGGGANLLDCTGSMVMAIEGSVPDIEAPTMSDVTMTAETSNRVKLTWTTNEPANSQVNYGLVSYPNSYSYSLTLADFSTTHTAVLEIGIEGGKTYYFVITTRDPTGNTTVTDEAAFTVPLTQTVVQTEVVIHIETLTRMITETVTRTETRTETKVVTIVERDTTPPQTWLSTKLQSLYPTAPAIEGVATDDKGVMTADYSTDGKKTWYPVGEIKPIGGKRVTYVFIPFGLIDGSYDVVVRVKDTSGNISYSRSVKLTIDRLPPRIGPVVIAAGQLQLAPVDEVISGIAGSPLTVTAAALGGVVWMEVFNQEGATTAAILRYAPESGLWTGKLLLGQPGRYHLSLRARDESGRVTEKQMSVLEMNTPGRVVDEAGPITGAKLTVMAYTGLSSPVVWEGAAFDQTRTTTNDQGEYAIFLPPGKYYLELTAAGYRNGRSGQFEVTGVQPLTQAFTLQKDRWVWAQPLVPWWRPKELVVKFPADSLATPARGEDQAPMPFGYVMSGQRQVYSSSWRGKPTLVVMLTGWMPQLSWQIKELEQLAVLKRLRVAVIMAQDSVAKVEALKGRGGYTVPLYADPDGEFTELMQPPMAPYWVWVDGNGRTIQKAAGLQTAEEVKSVMMTLGWEVR